MDTGRAVYRGVFMEGDGLGGCLFIAKSMPACQNEEIRGLFSQAALSSQERNAILSGGCSSISRDQETTLCACFDVSREKIQTALKDGETTTVEDLGERLKAGTNCGSCIPEIRALMKGGR